ncbi:hypothetical protein IJG93_02970 [Candidatus Saccharibacteria bacterium]|nr:hypothetical protein [Candidatus Saccharibacteria bacterium]
MAVYLIEPEVLGQIVDALIDKKYPNKKDIPAGLKNEAMQALDYQILRDILGSLTKEQGQELSALLDKDDSDEDALQKFFESQNIDLDKVVEKSMVDFKNRFLGGNQNA